MFVVTVGEGPLFGLQMTLNVQHYENLPFLDEDSGIKASIDFVSFITLQTMSIIYGRLRVFCTRISVHNAEVKVVMFAAYY